jgi:MoxR-like ATPase
MEQTQKLRLLLQQVSSVLLGKEHAVRQVIIALLSRGHVLLEDVPGVGKTILTRSLAASIDCGFRRIQLTPDLLPSDITGVSVYDSETGEFQFKKGPIFANIILADEVNRTTPRTQSALLEAMNESQVTADGQTFPLGPPFMVIATQNPYEFEGTYFLPENQLDRFMLRIRIGHPARDTEREILRTQPARTLLHSLQPVMSAQDIVVLQDKVQQVHVEDAIVNYILDITEATRRSDDLRVGLSPRASLAMLQVARASALLDGREYAVPDDVKQFAAGVCVHRLMARSFAQDGASTAAESVFQKILETIPVPE